MVVDPFCSYGKCQFSGKTHGGWMGSEWKEFRCGARYNDCAWQMNWGGWSVLENWKLWGMLPSQLKLGGWDVENVRWSMSVLLFIIVWRMCNMVWLPPLQGMIGSIGYIPMYGMFVYTVHIPKRWIFYWKVTKFCYQCAWSGKFQPWFHFMEVS